MAKAGQNGFFDVERGDGSFDYDCVDGPVEHWPTAGGNCGLGICALTEGWSGAVPECGASGKYVVSCGGLAICVPTTADRKQECH